MLRERDFSHSLIEDFAPLRNGASCRTPKTAQGDRLFRLPYQLEKSAPHSALRTQPQPPEETRAIQRAP